MNFRNQAGTQAPIVFQVTAIVDILMVLLVFFLYNYVSGQDEGQIKIAIPSAKHVDTSPISAPVFINVEKEGRIVLNGRVLTESALTELLTAVVQNNPHQSVLLRADKNAAYDTVLRVLDICQGAHVEGVGFAAIPARPQTSPSLPHLE